MLTDKDLQAIEENAKRNIVERDKKFASMKRVASIECNKVDSKKSLEIWNNFEKMFA